MVATSSAVFHPNKPQNILLPQWQFFHFFFFFSSLVFIMNWRSFALISCCFAVRFGTVPWHIIMGHFILLPQNKTATCSSFQGTHTSVCCSKGELCNPLDLSPSNGYCNWFPLYLSTGQWFIWWRALSNVWTTGVNNNISEEQFNIKNISDQQLCSSINAKIKQLNTGFRKHNVKTNIRMRIAKQMYITLN